MKAINLSFSYKNYQVLKDITLDFDDNITSIIGPNGCGKSTLLNLLNNYLKPTKGEVIIYDKSVKDYSSKELAKLVTKLSQQNIYPSDWNVEQLVSCGRLPVKNEIICDEVVESLLEICNIKKIRFKQLSKLSGGQRQMAFLAMVLAQESKYLLLDEPTTYLDIANQIEILEVIKKWVNDKKIKVIMVLHDLNQAIHYSDRLIALKDGMVVYDKSCLEIKNLNELKEIFNSDFKVVKTTSKHYIVNVMEDYDKF